MRGMWGLGAALGVAVMGPSGPAAAQHEPTRPDLLLREVVAGMPRGERQEVRVLTASFAPGQATVFHTHRFPVTVYVLEGAFTLDMEGREPVTVRAGQSMVEPPGVRMTGYNRGSGPLRVVMDFPPGSGGVRSERHAAARMVIPSMPARASTGVR